jgi:hypothetical protein
MQQFKFSGNIRSPETKRIQFEGFMGVDYANTPLNVALNRSSSISNLIHKDGANRKRPGWVEILNIEDANHDPMPINGFWSFKDKANNEHNIVHAGTKLFKVEFGSNSFSSDITDITPSGVTITNKISYGVVRGERLYLLCGTYLVYGKWPTNWVVRTVYNNEDTYIPTTTVGISALGSVINARTSLEEVNLLNDKRKNKLICENIESNVYRPSLFDYIDNTVFTNNPLLDTQIGYRVTDVPFTDVVGISIVIHAIGGTVRGVIYIDQDGILVSHDMAYYVNSTNIFYNGLTGEDLDTYLNNFDIEWNYDTDDTLNLIVRFEKKVTSTACEVYLVRKTRYLLDTKNINSIEKIDFTVGVTTLTYTSSNWTDVFEFDLTNGIVTCLNKGITMIAENCQMVVWFTKTISTNPDKINKCSFGTIFGFNDIEHFFISGNETYPNMDWHSSERDASETPNSTLTIHDDLTYFGDLGYATLGDSTNPIMAYSVLEDNTLGVFKSYSPNEPSLYLRNAYISDVISPSGDLVTDSNGVKFQKVYHSQFASAIGEGAVSKYTNKSLLGDKMFLSRNGIFGITLNSNIKSNERYARERSRLVNPKLIKEPNLNTAAAISYHDKYFLAVNDKVYIADAKFKNQLKGELDDTFSYEWWIWENMPVRNWFIYNNILCFGTVGGKICSLNNSSLEDVEYIHIRAGGVYFDPIDSVFTINQSYVAKIKDGDKVTFGTETGSLTELIITEQDIDSVNSGVFVINEELFQDCIRFTQIGIPIYVHGDHIYTYKVGEVNLDNHSIVIYLGDNVATNLNIPIKLYTPLTQSDIINVNSFHSTFKLKRYSEIYPYKQVVERDDVTGLSGYFTFKFPIKCLWASAILDLGTTDYSKNLDTITITPETVEGGVIDVALISRLKSKGFQTEGVNLFNFEDIDFTQFTLETSSFARSFTKRAKMKNINFIQIAYKSENNKDCVINNFSLVFRYSKRNKGVK